MDLTEYKKDMNALPKLLPNYKNNGNVMATLATVNFGNVANVANEK